MTSLREERREHIIKAAIKVFGKNKFHKTKMADIADQAQIGKSTIYEYFASKKTYLKRCLCIWRWNTINL